MYDKERMIQEQLGDRDIYACIIGDYLSFPHSNPVRTVINFGNMIFASSVTDR